jgi:NADPH:quinone reductase-like Zn-dependent oxidoreductase
MSTDLSVPSTMRAWRLRARGGCDGLLLEHVPVPVPGTGDVLVRVLGASYTPGELGWPSTWVDRSGHDRRPVIPCHEVSGVVASLGWGVRGVEIGDEVYGLTDWYRDGAIAEYIAVEARNLAPKPPELDHAAAATVPLAGLTAWQGLFRHGRLQAGQTVAVLGAGGGVGQMAVQLARDAGADVTGLGRPADAEVVMAAGADRFLDSALESAAPGSIAVVFDTVGGAVLDATWDALVDGGAVVSIAEPPAALRMAEHRAGGGYFVVEPDRGGLLEINRLIEAGTLHPAVGRVSSLEDARDVLMAKDRSEIVGKVAVAVS